VAFEKCDYHFQQIDQTNLSQHIWISFIAERLFPGSGYQVSCIVSTNLQLPTNPKAAPNLRSWILDCIDHDRTSVAYKTACCLGAGFFAGNLVPPGIFLVKSKRHAGTHSTSLDRYKEGSMWYIKAIQQLNTNLEDPELRKDPANIAASLLLGIYEVSRLDS
jgi:hypothetical protein